MPNEIPMIRTYPSLTFSLILLFSINVRAQNSCPKANALNVSSLTEVSAQLNWSGSDEHTSYTVDVMHGPQTPNFKYSTTTGNTEAAVAGLQPGSAYRFRVKPKCEKGSGGSSKWFEFTTAGEKPSDDKDSEGQGGAKCPKLVDIEVTNISDTSATLSWSEHSDYTEFAVDVMHAPQNPNYKWSTVTNETEILVSDLKPGRSYRFRIKASCAKGKSNSKWHTFTTTGIDSTGHGRCPKASNLAVLDVTDSTVVLSWLGNPENVTYQVDVHQKEHTPQFRLSETVDTTALKVTGLVAGGNYKFRVKAACEKNAAGSSSWINFVTTGGDTTFNQCPKPRNLSVLDVSDTSALLTWIARDSIWSFDLEIKSFQGTASYAFDTTLMDTFYHVTDLQPEGNYHFRLKANCSDTSSSGSSDWSKFRTLADTSSGAGVSESDVPFETTEATIVSFPNPVEEEFVVQLPIERMGALTYVILTDLVGRVVYEKILREIPTDANLFIPVDNLRPGIYKLMVKSTGIQNHKTIVVR